MQKDNDNKREKLKKLKGRERDRDLGVFSRLSENSNNNKKSKESDQVPKKQILERRMHRKDNKLISEDIPMAVNDLFSLGNIPPPPPPPPSQAPVLPVTLINSINNFLELPNST